MSRESEEDEKGIYCPYKLQIVGQCAFLLGRQIVEKNLAIDGEDALPASSLEDEKKEMAS